MMILYIIISLLLIFLLLVFIPMKGKRYKVAVPVRHIDERNTMFSRNDLEPGDKRFEAYYASHPENKAADDTFRSRPGLLSRNATYYNRFAFAAAEAGFEAVKAFFSLREGTGGHAHSLQEASPEQPLFPSDEEQGRKESRELSDFLKNLAVKLGAAGAGISVMQDYHYYTYGGRGDRYGQKVSNDHKYGIALTVEMDYKLTRSAPRAPVVMESARQYLSSGMIATHLALTLRNLGYEASSHIDANYDVICPLVARDAGLGEIGRMGLLMTPRQGPRVRIAVVTTSAPLMADKPAYDNSVIDFCTLCKKCARVCPSSSIPHDQRRDHPGGLRWQIDQEKCFTYWCSAGTDCARCMAVCPYSHPSNLFHDFIRWGIRNNFIFRRLAVKLDDLFYGSKPSTGKSPEWISH